MYTVPVNFGLNILPLPSVRIPALAPFDTTKGKIFNAVEVQPAFPGGEARLDLFDRIVALSFRDLLLDLNRNCNLLGGVSLLHSNKHMRVQDTIHFEDG